MVSTQTEDTKKALMTYEEAVAEAKSQRRKGKTFADIERSLKRKGYLSPKTKRPVGALAIRQMLQKELELTAEEEVEEENSNPAIETPPTAVMEPKIAIAAEDLGLSTIVKILTLDALPLNAKIKIAQTLLADMEKTLVN